MGRVDGVAGSNGNMVLPGPGAVPCFCPVGARALAASASNRAAANTERALLFGGRTVFAGDGAGG